MLEADAIITITNAAIHPRLRPGGFSPLEGSIMCLSAPKIQQPATVEDPQKQVSVSAKAARDRDRNKSTATQTVTTSGRGLLAPATVNRPFLTG